MRPTRPKSRFTRFSKWTAHVTGRPAAFGVAFAIVAVWLLTGPAFGYSDTWQLAINTATTIVTFLMVFLIQCTQNRDAEAVQVKLDELIRATQGTHNILLDLEELEDEELDRIHRSYELLAQRARRRGQGRTRHRSARTGQGRGGQMNSQPATPWFKERWPWILMSGPAVVIVAGVITTWIAFATADGLVADDYYKRGLGVNAVLKREQAAAQRGIEARVERAGGQVRVLLRGAEPPVLFLNLVHATRAGFDVRLRLERGPDGGYAAPLPALAPGHWRAVVDDPRGEWRIVQEFL